jgi:Resolvase, N terminal domain
LQSLLDRAAKAKDFDVLVAVDFSRLTRRGTEEGLSLLHHFAEVGVEILTANCELRAAGKSSNLASIVKDLTLRKERARERAKKKVGAGSNHTKGHEQRRRNVLRSGDEHVVDQSGGGGDRKKRGQKS